jgi:hypothetical protein
MNINHEIGTLLLCGGSYPVPEASLPLLYHLELNVLAHNSLNLIPR